MITVKIIIALVAVVAA